MATDNPKPSDFPKVSAPAIRALNAAGYFQMEQLTQVTEAEIAALHGMGLKGVRILKEALHERGLDFAQP